jgi:hypothetical protein
MLRRLSLVLFDNLFFFCVEQRTASYLDALCSYDVNVGGSVCSI